MLFNEKNYQKSNQIRISNMLNNNHIIDKNFKINLQNVINTLPISNYRDYNLSDISVREAAHQMSLGEKLRAFESAWNNCVAAKLESLGKKIEDITAAVINAGWALVTGATVAEAIGGAAITLGITYNVLCVKDAIDAVNNYERQWN